MDENQDCREEVINKLAVWATSGIDDVREAKCDLYLLLSDVEITSRHTKVFSVQEDRNEYLLKKFLLVKQVKGCTEKTLKSYERSIKATLKQIGKTVDDITADDIRCYIAFRLRKNKVLKVTVAGEIAIFSSFFTWLYLEEIIKRNPMSKVDKIKTEKIKKRAFTELEIEKLRLATENAREQTIVEMLLSTGCRVTELTEILLADIEGSKILVRGKGAKERYVYLNAKAQLALEQYLNERKDNNPFLFPKGKMLSEWDRKGLTKEDMKSWWKDREKIKDGHIDKGSIEKVVVRIAKRAGIDKANPHKFRRTCATMALKRGMPLLQVSKMLGHESTETTQIYLDLSEDDLAQAHKKYVV